MYNRYLASSAHSAPPLHNPQPAAGPAGDGFHSEAQEHAPRGEAPHAPPQAASVFGDLGRLFSGRLTGIKLDMDTILVLVVVWFLISEGEDMDWDLILMIGGLLILGI